jgi:WD40 repeat protein
LLLVNTKRGLWTARPDGSDGALRITGPLIIPGPLSGAVSAVDGNFAYLTTSDFTRAYGNYPNLKLNILSLFGLGPFVSLPLTSPQTEPGDQNPSDIIRAMVEHEPFAWSPDGKRLAYIGAAQGPSADLYEYLLDTGATLRLTDGPDQAYDPLWSPDGKWIVHTAAAGFGTGAGIPVTGFYAARPDGSGVISLYDIPQYSGGEYGTGWLDAHTLVTSSWYITCGFSDVRLADLSAQKADLAFKGCVSAIAVAPGRGSVLFAQSPDTASFDKNPQPGLYLITEDQRSPRLISDADIKEIVWSEGIGSFLARSADNLLYEVSPSGDIRNLAVNKPQIPTVSPDGRYWVLADAFYPNSVSGVWVGEYGKELRQIFADKIAPGQILFSPTGDAIYFLDTIGNLYRAQAPDWVPAILTSDLLPAADNLSLAWVRK